MYTDLCVEHDARSKLALAKMFERLGYGCIVWNRTVHGRPRASDACAIDPVRLRAPPRAAAAAAAASGAVAPSRLTTRSRARRRRRRRRARRRAPRGVG